MSSRGGSRPIYRRRECILPRRSTRCEHAVTRLRNENVERARIFRTEISRGEGSLRRGGKRSISPWIFGGKGRRAREDTIRIVFPPPIFRLCATRRTRHGRTTEGASADEPRSRRNSARDEREHQLMENGGRTASRPLRPARATRPTRTTRGGFLRADFRGRRATWRTEIAAVEAITGGGTRGDGREAVGESSSAAA